MKPYFRRITVSALSMAVGSCILATPVMAEEFRAGYVNTDRLFREAALAKTAQTRLEQEFSKREKELVEMRSNLKTASEKFERDAPTLSESQRATRQKQLVEQDRDFQRKSREFQEDVDSRKREEFAALADRANRVVKQIAETEKYDVIFNEGLIYMNPKHDITDKVLKALNTSGTASAAGTTGAAGATGSSGGK